MAETKVTPNELLNTVTATTNSGTAGGSLNSINLGGLKYCWGTTSSITATAGTTGSGTVVFPSSFFTSAPVVTCSAGSWTGTAKILGGANSDPTTTGFTPQAQNFDIAGGTAKISWIAIGI